MAEKGKFRKKTVPFTQVSNAALRDETLSLKAKGLYALIQSFVTLDGFTLYKSFLQGKCKESHNTFDTTWKELKDKGYLIQYKMRDKNNRWVYEYELLDTPLDTPQPKNKGMEKGNFPQPNFPHMENPPHGKVGCINNTDINNTDLNNIDRLVGMERLREKYGDLCVRFYELKHDQYGKTTDRPKEIEKWILLDQKNKDGFFKPNKQQETKKKTAANFTQRQYDFDSLEQMYIEKINS